MSAAEDIIARLDLVPHPEGGHYRETARIAAADGGRSPMTAIYFLLQGAEKNAWHRVDATEIWHFHAGAPLILSVSADGRNMSRETLGNDLAAGERPQVIVPPGAWQSASCTGDWTLVGCTVGPGFEFAHFELAPPSWSPGEHL